MRAPYLGMCGRVVQKGIGEPHMFLLKRASWAEPTGSVYWSSRLHTKNNERKNTLVALVCLLSDAFILHNNQIIPAPSAIAQTIPAPSATTQTIPAVTMDNTQYY